MEYGVHIRDPRPIKDKAFQRTRIQKLVNFFIQSGFYNKKAVPAYQQVFQDIFKFLYLKLEPGHEFQKKFGDEISSSGIDYKIILSGCRTTSLVAKHVGIARLDDVILVMERIKEILDAPPMGGGMSRGGGGDLNPELDMTKVPSRRFTLPLPIASQRHIGIYATRTEKALKHKVVLGKEQLTLRQDIGAFQKAFEHAEPRIEGVRKANAEKQASTAAKKEEHAAVERAKIELREIIQGQNLTRVDLESKVEEPTRLIRREESLNKQLQDLKQELWTVDGRNQEAITRQIKIGIVPQSANNAGGRDYELQPDLDRAEGCEGSDRGMQWNPEHEREGEWIDPQRSVRLIS
ncbi:MAG: hypothetical protein J3Q66DRAFT_438546 [Benniella sp.]|nr:MAG: hypothetical protein J3Q66DRAFT_438546 [Benniella sp.]